VIKQIDKDTFETIFKGRVYTLIRYETGGYSMWNKTLNGRANPPKSFDNLDQVEAKYKHWQGINLLINL